MLTNKELNRLKDQITENILEADSLDEALECVTESFDILDSHKTNGSISSAMYLDVSKLIYQMKNDIIEEAKL